METVTLTYDDLAARLGISGSSARNLVRRKHWKRVPGNDGKTRVECPVEALPEAPRVAPSEAPQHAVVVARLETQIDGLKALVEAEKRRGDEAVARLADVEADRTRWMREAGRPWWRRLTA